MEHIIVGKRILKRHRNFPPIVKKIKRNTLSLFIQIYQAKKKF